MATEILITLALVAAAYLLGSIPTAVWVGKQFYNIDIREHGSKNAGATNTIRVLGVKAGLAVFIVDVLKGFAAVKLAPLAPHVAPESNAGALLAIALGIAAFLGHLFPIFAQFKGGKGVATLCGVIFALHTAATLITLAVFTIVLASTRYVSLSSITAGIAFPLILYFPLRVRQTPLLIFAACAALLLLYTHRANIKRLINGEESKFAPSKKGSLSSHEKN